MTSTILIPLILIKTFYYSSGIGSGDLCDENSIQLIGGSSDSSGRLEVCYDGRWGTVCDVSFTLNDGNVICKQLGFFGATRLASEFGPGTSDIVWLGDLDCQGTESSLSECSHAEFFSGPPDCQPCHHNQDIGVICRPHEDICEEGSIRLSSDLLQSNDALEGIVELCVEGLWGAILSTQYTDNDGKVACRQLGYSFVRAYPIPAGLIYLQSRRTSFRLWSFSTYCHGNESSLYHCDHSEVSSTIFRLDSVALYANCYNNIQLLTNSTTIVLGPTTIKKTVNLTCTTSIDITDSETKWRWIFQDQELESNDRYRVTQDLFTDTSTAIMSSTLQIINPQKTDEGSYNCSFNYTNIYQHEVTNIYQTHYLKFEAELSGINISTEMNSLSCEVYGYILSNTTYIDWFRDSDPIQITDGQYNVTISNNSQNVIVTGQGIRVPSIISTLHIYTPDIVGNYSCTVYDGSSVLCEYLFLNNADKAVTLSTMSNTPNSIASSTLTGGSVAGIAVGSVIIISLMCCVPIMILLFFERSRKLHRENLQHVPLAHDMISGSHKIDTYIQQKKLNEMHLSVINSSDLKLMEKVGQGEFGVVYRGVYKTESLVMSVAIKTVKGLYSEYQVDELLVEADKMKLFDHLHILSLTGVCVGLLESPCIVMPFMSNGSLLSYLRREAADLTINEIADENVRNSILKHLLSICLQVAKGMEYLSQQKFIHRDLAARNCMISSEGIIKIADFGLAEDIYTSVYFKRPNPGLNESVKLPLKWMALESIHLGKYDEKTDVWSYGVLCWEVFNGGKTPYPGSTPKEVVTMLDNGERLTKPINAACIDEVYSMMLSCWENSPKCRPHFFELLENINKLLVPLADYIDMVSDLKLNT